MEQVAALKRRRAYIIAKLYNVGESIRATEKELFGKQGPPEVYTLLKPSRRNLRQLNLLTTVGHDFYGSTPVPAPSRKQELVYRKPMFFGHLVWLDLVFILLSDSIYFCGSLRKTVRTQCFVVDFGFGEGGEEGRIVECTTRTLPNDASRRHCAL